MRACSNGEVLFCLVCLMLLSASVESFNWTAQPTNPTLAIKGQDVSLTWNYSLTADEQLKSQTYHSISWSRLTQSSSGYDNIGIKTFIVVLNVPSLTYGEPQKPHIVININDPATLHIKDVRREDEGTYKIEVVLQFGGNAIADHKINLTVLELSEIGNVSNNQDVCEGSIVTLNCNATGKPTPNITWTRVWENGTDSEQLQVVDGNYVMSNIKRSSNGTYRCTAYNGVGDPVNRTVDVIVGFAASVEQAENITIKEVGNVKVYCNASGIPDPTVTWINVKSGNLTEGNLLNITNITRSQAGEYRCIANNTCGEEASTVVDINVQYKPDMVTLATNTTENKDCSDLWVNFTCNSSEANPPVYNYQLFEDGKVFSSSKSGTWIEKISREGKVIYNCVAYQLVGNVTSTKNVILTVNVPLSMNEKENEIVKKEGENFEVYCNMTGFPEPTVIWKNVKSGDLTEGNWLNITNITRAQAGEYRCTANNTCGNESTVVDIDVQYKPENVHLKTNITSNKVCTGIIINFTCTAEANPPVHSYVIYKNNTMTENMTNLRTVIKTMDTAGRFVFRCEANNSVQGTGRSSDTILTVDVPASVEQAENEIVNEGGNVEVYCNVTGIPDPTVTWTNVKYGNLTVKGNWLNITNITRAQAGEYRCTANNTCGEASTVVDIDVQYKPEDVRLTTNTTVKVCAGMIMNFTCTAEANPEADTYLLYENDVMIMNMGKLGTQIKTMKTDGGFVFRCEANNSVQGTGRSSDTNLTVDVATSIELEEKTIVKEGDDVEVYCNASGIPGPTVTWTNATSGDLIEGNPLNITDITRAQAGKYRCTANNTCGNESTVVEIDVQCKNIIIIPFVFV